MTNLINTQNTITSLEFLDVVNASRIASGESPHEPRKFLAKVEDELDDLTGKKFRLNNNQSKTYYYDLTVDQCMLVGMRESKSVRRSVLAKLKELEAPKPMTQLEVLAGLTNAMVEQERKQLEQAQAVKAIESKLERVEAKAESQVWDECPVNALSISAIRQRINNKYSIPHWAIDEIVRGGYGPRPAGQVRNSHESANGRTYTVYWLSDITKLFDRIVKDAEPVTATLCTHEYVSKRFKMMEG